ncbi:MAG: Gfo/Idh/MocA family oxidoreductase [Acidobacteria bacterium]|nr:Gfo/Idh/MocA family oxidoreductase [Acidobacteriota bacterium]
MSLPVDRRDFLKSTLGAGVGAAALASSQPVSAQRQASASATLFAAPALPRVRVGVIGLGNQGPSHVENFTKIEGVDIVALCDLVPAKVEKVQAMVEKAGAPRPAGYSGNPDAWRRLCDSDLDLVFIATPWDMHAPMAIEAMKKGKHAAVEVPMAVTLDECWQMVETAEQTKRHCVMMENCCYDRVEMMILNMVRQQVFGELLHAECGYLHDLRALKLSPTYYENRWRIDHSVARNGDVYPTHGLGPVAQWLDINRGNRFESLVSMSTNARGLAEFAAAHIGPTSREATQRYALGDVVNTLIRTSRGQTVLVTHDTNLPRPYSRRILLQGARGLVQKYPEPRIHIEGRSPEHKWDDLLAWREQYEHPVWKTLEERSRGAGHGGMDFIEDFRLIQSLRTGTPMDMDVYDGAALSSVSALSEQSIAGGRVVAVPDFTRGAWQQRPALGIVNV